MSLVIAWVGYLWAKVTVLPPHWAATLALVIFLGVFLGLSAWKRWQDQRIAPMPEPPPPEPATPTDRPVVQPVTPAVWQRRFRDQLEDWLLGAAYRIGRIPLPLGFSLQAVGERAPYLVEIAQGNDLRQLLLIVHIQIREDWQPRLDTLTGTRNPTLLFDLRDQLGRIEGIEFDGLDHPLRLIRIVHRVLCDENLTELSFVTQHMVVIQRAALLAFNVLNRARGVIEESAVTQPNP